MTIILVMAMLLALTVPALAEKALEPNILNASSLDNVAFADTETMMRDRAFFLSDAVTIESAEQLIRLLREAVRDGREYTLIYADPEAVPIKNEKPGWADLHSSIYDHFHYGKNGGLFTEREYSIFSGPGVWYELDGENGWKYYCVVFDYNTNNDERAECDGKLRKILAEVYGASAGEQLRYFYRWMKANLPAEKFSDTGYPPQLQRPVRRPVRRRNGLRLRHLLPDDPAVRGAGGDRILDPQRRLSYG